jgi:SAM-dependent methyltransferase
MSHSKPIFFRRVATRLACTFLPWIVPTRRGVTTPQHWDAHPTSVFDQLHPASLALMQEIVELAPDRATPILDLGCNVGRHLNHLHGLGYRNLRGVDFSRRAIEDMAQRYPEMHRVSRLTVASFQDYFAGNPEAADISYTRGATFELVHPRFPLIEQVCRHTRRHVVMVIKEAGHLFPRYWEYEFARQGFELAHLRRPASKFAPEHDVSLLTFTRLT